MSILTFPQNSWEVQTDVVLRVHSPHSVCAMVKSGILACPAKMFFQPVLLKNKCWSENFNICPYHIVIELGYPYSLKISLKMSFQSTYFLFFSLEIGMYVSASGHYSENKFCNDAILLLKCGWSISFVWSNISLPPKKEPYQLHFCSITVVQEHFVLQSLNHPYTTMPLSCLEVMQGKPFKTRVKESSSTVV